MRRPVPVGPGGAPLAEFWQRLVAYIIDGLIVTAAILIPMLLLFALVFVPFVTSIEHGATPDPLFVLPVWALLSVMIAALNVVASYVYFVRMCHRTGQTIGKRVMKIRVVRAFDGGPVDLRALKRRWVVQHVSALVAAYFNLADGLWQLWDQPYRQCLHDKCAETVVVQVAA
nr:RDD family protein [Planosporangium flavigriseum]